MGLSGECVVCCAEWEIPIFRKDTSGKFSCVSDLS
jgi:hypothetical protein